MAQIETKSCSKTAIWSKKLFKNSKNRKRDSVTFLKRSTFWPKTHVENTRDREFFCLFSKSVTWQGQRSDLLRYKQHQTDQTPSYCYLLGSCWGWIVTKSTSCDHGETYTQMSFHCYIWRYRAMTGANSLNWKEREKSCECKRATKEDTT